MLRGRFGDTTGRPYIEGRLILPTQGLNSDLSFLVDTGADSSMLMPADALRMGRDYGKLARKTESVGIGGRSPNFVEHATLVSWSRSVPCTCTSSIFGSSLPIQRSWTYPHC